MRKIYAPIGLLVAVLLVVPVSSPTSAASGEIRMCVNKQTRETRVLKPNKKKCRKNERLVIVNAAGVPGKPGQDGKSGSVGDKGEKGDAGATGAQGPSGATGPAGATGAQGPAGAKGDKGDTGDTGPAGAKGDKGDTGDTGPAGAKGDTGDTGPAGSSGFGASISSNGSATSVVSGKRYLVVWSGTVTPDGTFLDPGMCRLSANFGAGPVLIDGGVAFGKSGTSSATPVIYNTVRSTTFMTATASSVTFSTVCIMRRAGGDENSNTEMLDLELELIPFN